MKKMEITHIKRQFIGTFQASCIEHNSLQLNVNQIQTCKYTYSGHHLEITATTQYENNITIPNKSQRN